MGHALHRTLWRWHFWAGLIVAPFLLILSATGAIYLFGEELNDALYPAQRFVAPHRTSVAVSRMIGAARAAYPGAVGRIDLPDATDRPAVVYLTPDHGAPLRVSVDPGSGRVLGHVVAGETLVDWADAMHGSLTIGTLGDRIVELAACWTLVLLATGLILWWPRGRWRVVGTIVPRLSGSGRRFWRDLHGPVGLWSAGLIAFLIVTGLPWAGVTGDLLQRATTATGTGYPASYRTHNQPHSVTMKAALGVAPWTLEGAPIPQSSGHAGHATPPPTDDAAAIAGTDRVAGLLAARSLTGGYRLFLPAGPTGVYTAYTYPGRPQGQRTIHVDRYTLAPIGREVRFADYGGVAQAVELGVQLHMGRYFGRANQLLMLVPCIAIWLLVGSGIAMWWTRRPHGAFGAPPRVEGMRLRWLAAVLLAAAILMPLFGASLLAVVALDAIVRGCTRGWRSSSGSDRNPT